MSRKTNISFVISLIGDCSLAVTLRTPEAARQEATTQSIPMPDAKCPTCHSELSFSPMNINSLTCTKSWEAGFSSAVSARALPRNIRYFQIKANPFGPEMACASKSISLAFRLEPIPRPNSSTTMPMALR